MEAKNGTPGPPAADAGNPLFKAWQWRDGVFVECDSLPLSDRGFRYGMSVFESFRVMRGSPEFFEPHLARLLHACADRDFDVEEEALQNASTLFQTEEFDGFARIYVTAGDGPPTAPASRPRIFVFIECRTPPDPDETLEIGLHEESYRAAIRRTEDCQLLVQH